MERALIECGRREGDEVLVELVERKTMNSHLLDTKEVSTIGDPHSTDGCANKGRSVPGGREPDRNRVEIKGEN